MAQRSAQMQGELAMEIGDQIRSAPQEGKRGEPRAQLSAEAPEVTTAEMSAEPPLDAALRRLGIAADRVSMNAVRMLMSAGQPVTRENVSRLVRGQVGGAYAGPDQPAIDGILVEILQLCGLPADSAHMEAVRQLMSRGTNLTKGNLLKSVREQPFAPHGQEKVASDAILGGILRSLDLPDDLPHLYAVRQLMVRGQPLSGDGIDRLARTLVRLGAVEEEDFAAAVFLQVNDLPVTESTISLARGALEKPLRLGQQLRQLQTAVSEAAVALLSAPPEEAPPEGELEPLLDRAATQLSQRLLSAGTGDREAMVDTLRRLFADQSTSLESRLAAVLAGADPEQLEGDLRTLLGRLADMAARAGAAPSQNPELQRALAQLSQAAPELANALQSQQLGNVVAPTTRADQWIVFQLPVSVGSRDEPSTAELRISRRPGRRIDPEHARLLLRLDLPHLRMVEIGLQIVGSRVTCSLSSSNDEALPLLREQFSDLRQGLEGLGYSVSRPFFSLLAAEPAAAEAPSAVPTRLGRLDVSV
jgi:hypothetical protein